MLSQMKTELVDEVKKATGDQLTAVDRRLEQQGERLDQVQMKVNLSLESIGKLQQEQVHIAKGMKGPALPPLVIPARDGPGIMGSKPHTGQVILQNPTPTQISFPPPTPIESEVNEANRVGEIGGRRTWIPKMDFLKFDGTDSRIWIYKCQTFFSMYQIPDWEHLQPCI